MSETARRILSSAILVPLFLFSFYYPDWYYIQLYLLCGAAIYLGMHEFYAFANKGDEGKPFIKTGIFYAFLIFSAYYIFLLSHQTKVPVPNELKKFLEMFSGKDAVPAIIMTAFIHIYILQILFRQLDGAIYSTSSTIAGMLYLSIPCGHFLKLVSLENGIYYIWIVAGLTFITDAGAYFGGRWFGRHPAGLKISPKKTWEGYVTGLITSLIFTLTVNYFWPRVTGKPTPMGYLELVLFTPVMSIISVAGDLSESAMKRDAKMKDSASVIPGHGGLLDLADAVFFTVPASYIYISIKEALGMTV